MASITSFRSVSGAGPPDAWPNARRTGSLAICSTNSPSGARTKAADRGTTGIEVCSAARMKPKITSSRIRWRTLRTPSRIRQTRPKNPARADPTLIQCLRSAGVMTARRSDFLVDACRFTGQITQVVELGAPYGAAPLDADFADGGAMGLEHPLHTFAMRNLADG